MQGVALFHMKRAYIYSPSGKAQKLYKLLQRKRRYRYPRIKRRRRTSASEAAKYVWMRVIRPSISVKTFGHWEGDLIVFTQQKANVITLREHKSRYLGPLKMRIAKHKQQPIP